MVPLPQIQASNAQLTSSLPPDLVAVFVGATSGIGEAALKEFIRRTVKPRCYLVGRSEQAALCIIKDCKALNPDAQIIFTRADVSLIKEADRICKEIISKESSINLIFLSAGAAILDRCQTTEGLHALTALSFYSRLRITQLLLPLMQRSTHLARVINIAGGTKEGHLYPSDIQALNIPFYAIRGHLATLISLSHKHFCTSAPDVSFIQVYPGSVQTALFDRVPGITGTFIRFGLKVMGRWVFVPTKESAERNVFFCTSQAFPSREGTMKNGAKAVEGLRVARGIDGQTGSGVYSVNYDGSEAGQTVIRLLAGYEKEGMVEKVWEHVQAQFGRIAGTS